MINREIIRLKVVQLVYADLKNEGRPVNAVQKELLFSLSKTYELYQYLLLLMVDITDYATKRYESYCERLEQIGSSERPSDRFVKNRFALQLADNRQLNEFANSPKKHRWTEAESVVRGLYKQVVESNIYKEYMAEEGDSYDADRELWRKIYKRFICRNDDIDGVLEEWSIYWNDDKDIVDTFVLKTIKRFDEALGADQPLLPAYADEEDKTFAEQLFNHVFEHREEFEDLIRQSTINWSFDRLAVMDVVIMMCALAEIMYVPQIDVNVSLNEYINLAKIYSSPKSAGYVNAILDHIIGLLRDENRLFK